MANGEFSIHLFPIWYHPFDLSFYSCCGDKVSADFYASGNPINLWCDKLIDENKRKLKKELLARMSRRNLAIGGGQIALGLLLAGRLYQLQISQSAGWSRLSDSNQFNTRAVTPARGRIFDASNRLIAGNSETYSLSITLPIPRIYLAC